MFEGKPRKNMRVSQRLIRIQATSDQVAKQ